jgi:hypothetical protein
MPMFPGAGAQVYCNEAGEPLGWDCPGDDPPEYDPDLYLGGDDYDEGDEPVIAGSQQRQDRPGDAASGS